MRLSRARLSSRPAPAVVGRHLVEVLGAGLHGEARKEGVDRVGHGADEGYLHRHAAAYLFSSDVDLDNRDPCLGGTGDRGSRCRA